MEHIYVGQQVRYLEDPKSYGQVSGIGENTRVLVQWAGGNTTWHFFAELRPETLREYLLERGWSMGQVKLGKPIQVFLMTLGVLLAVNGLVWGLGLGVILPLGCVAQFSGR